MPDMCLLTRCLGTSKLISHLKPSSYNPIWLIAGAAGAAGHGAPDGLSRAGALAPVLHRGARRHAAGHAAGAAQARARVRAALRRLVWQRRRARSWCHGAILRAHEGWRSATGI